MRAHGGDDGVAELGEGEGALPFVVEGAVVGGSAVGDAAGGAVGEEDGVEGLGGGVGCGRSVGWKRARGVFCGKDLGVRQQGVGTRGDGRAVDVFGQVEEAGKTEAAGDSPVAAQLLRWNVFPTKQGARFS